MNTDLGVDAATSDKRATDSIAFSTAYAVRR